MKHTLKTKDINLTDPQRTAKGLLLGLGVDKPLGVFQEQKHTWSPASSPTRSCILRWYKGGLEQLYFCKESKQAKWKKVPKEI